VDGWVDLERGQVERDVPVSLTDRETRMLGYLAARPATPCATEELLQEVWGYNARVRSRAVDAAVHRLRRKLEVDPKNPVHLVTVYGKGVYFRPAEPEARRVEGDFVGREELLEELVECLEQRSVQLMGAGGVGKTRVARELLARRDGVFCSLSQETDIAGAVRAIAWTLGVDPDLVASGEASLAEAMGARGLVVLDNVEWVTGIGPWIDALGPEVRVLATTRRQLEGYLEKVVLSPLGLDDSVALLQSLTGLGRTPALDAVASAVGGVPLALRLVHRHLTWLTPEAVAERAQRLLSEDVDGGSEQSIAEVVRVSLDHLQPEVRAGMHRLGAYPLVNWPVDAAAAVVGSLEGLRALVEASLLERQAELGLLELHPLVHGQLQPGAEGCREAHRRLREWFAPWAVPLLREEAAPEQLDVLFALAPLLRALEPLDDVARFGAGLAAYERGDLRSALELVQGADGREGLVGARLRLLRAQVERRLGQGVEAATALAAELEGSDWAPELRSAGWQLVAGAWASAGRHQEAIAAYERAEEGAGSRSSVEQALMLFDRCKSEARLGEVDAAYQRAQLAWNDLDEGPSTYRVNGLNTLGTLALLRQRLTTARGWFEKALDLVADDPQRAAVLHGNLAAVELARGRADEATKHAQAALDAHRRTGRRRGMVFARTNLGRAFLLQERWLDAVTELEQACALAQFVGLEEHVRWNRAFLAVALAGAGDVDEARAELAAAGIDDDVGQIAAAMVAKLAGEPYEVPPEASISRELRAHWRALGV